MARLRKVVTILERLPHPGGEEILRSTPSFSRHLWVQPGVSCLGIFKELGLHEERHYVHQAGPLPHCILAENGFWEPLASISIASCHVSQEGPQDCPKAKQRKPKCMSVYPALPETGSENWLHPSPCPPHSVSPSPAPFQLSPLLTATLFGSVVEISKHAFII